MEAGVQIGYARGKDGSNNAIVSDGDGTGRVAEGFWPDHRFFRMLPMNFRT